MRSADGIGQPDINMGQEVTYHGQIELSKIFLIKDNVVTHSVTVLIFCSHFVGLVGL